MKYFGFLWLCLFLSIYGRAAVIKGQVTDEAGNRLGYATIQIEGTQTGVMADENGNYRLTVPQGTYTLVCRYTAHKTVRQRVTVSAPIKQVNFRLPQEQLQINDVVIHANAEDPAMAIMRHVIALRKTHEKLIKTLETDIYLKGDLRVVSLPKFLKVSINGSDGMAMGLDSNGTGIIYLLEEKSHYTYSAPNHEFNKVLSVRVSGDPHGLGLAMMPPILNIYRNNLTMLNLNNRGFISPASSDAFHYYRYKYLGSFQQNGHTIDKIKVIPKRKFEPVFSGVVYVAEKDWVFSEVDLRLTKTSQISGIDTVFLRQRFQPTRKGIWVIRNQVLGLRLRLFGIKVKGSFLTVYQDEKVNQPVNQDLFSGKVISSYAKDATEKDTTYWNRIRPVPMKVKERRNFQMKDSLAKVAQKKTDSLYNAFRKDFGPGSVLFGGPSMNYKNDEWRIRPLVRAIQFNTVEGLSATLGLSWKHNFSDSTGHFKMRWLNRYGFHNHHFNSLIDFETVFKNKFRRKRNIGLGFSVGQYVFEYNRQNPIMPIMNELYTLFAGRNYLKLFENRLVSVHLKRNWGNGFKGFMALSYEQRRVLKNSTDYTFRKTDAAVISPNIPVGHLMLDRQTAAIVHLSLSYRPGVKYIRYPKYERPVFIHHLPQFGLDYEQGVPLGQATAKFIKWQLEMSHGFGLHMGGHVDYHLKVGGFLDKSEVNLPDEYHINGNRTFLAAPYLNSFQLAPYYRFSGVPDVYGEGHLEWHLDGLLTNKIPGFRRLNWFLVAGGNVLYINKTNYYAEAFVGFENIGAGLFRFGRVDFIAGYQSDIERPLLGVRLSFGGIFHKLFDTQKGKYL